MVYRRYGRPSYRRPYRRPMYRRRRGPYRTAPTYGQIGAKVWKDVQMLKNLINVEFKYKDSGNTGSIDTSGAVRHLNDITQGDGATQRGGAQARLKSLNCLGNIVKHASATQTTVRVLFFIWKDVNLTAPVVSDVLDGGALLDLKNLDEKRNFVILKDRMYTLDADHPIQVIKYYRKLDLKTLWKSGSTNGGSTNTEYGGVYMLVISSEATNTPTYDINTRISFVDN